MASNAADTTRGKATKHQTKVLGRSAASGRFVLVPAKSKGATISIKEANTAVESISSKSENTSGKYLYARKAKKK